MTKSTNTIDSCRESDTGRRITPFAEWEWLRTPALLFVMIGGLGLLAAHIEIAAVRLAFLRLPPAWSCSLMIGGGIILFAIALAARCSRCEQPLQATKRKSWRSL